MKYCPYCGYKVENVYTFCPKCGQSIPDVYAKSPQKEKNAVSPEVIPDFLVVQKAKSEREPAQKNFQSEVISAFPAVQKTEPESEPVQRTFRSVEKVKNERKDIQKSENAEYRPAWKDDPLDYTNESNNYRSAWESDAETFLLGLSRSRSTDEKGRGIENNSFPESSFETADKSAKTKSEDHNMSEQQADHSQYRTPEYMAPVYNSNHFETKYIEQPQPVEHITVSTEEDSGGFGWWFLSFIFPLVGLILYLNSKGNKPGRAHSAASGALVMLIIIAAASAVFLFGVMVGYISLV